MMKVVSSDTASEHNRRWAATMEGYEGAADDVTVAHQNSQAVIEVVAPGEADAVATLRKREEQLDAFLAKGARSGQSCAPGGAR